MVIGASNAQTISRNLRMSSTQVNYIYTKDLKSLDWRLLKKQIEMRQRPGDMTNSMELVISLGSNDIFPCRKENKHYHFNSRFPCDRDKYVTTMTELINHAAPLFRRITVLPPLPRLLEKQCKCQNAAYYPGSLETVTNFTVQLRNTVKELEGCSVIVVTINQLMRGLYIANWPFVEEWIEKGTLPPKQSLGQMARERQNTRNVLTELFKDGVHFSELGYFLLGKGVSHLLESQVGHLDGTANAANHQGRAGSPIPSPDTS